ncbi:MAG: response regulator [Bacteroidota bacterium]
MTDKPSYLTPPDANKKVVNEILRRVDALIRERDYAKAFLEIQRAKGMDPKNPYVHAYEERMSGLIEEKKKNDLDAEKNRKETPVPVPVRPVPVTAKEQTVPSVPPAHPVVPRTPVPPQEVTRPILTPTPPQEVTRPIPAPPVPHTRSGNVDATHGGHGMLRMSEHTQLAKRRYTVMIVDDDKDLLHALAETLRNNDLDAVSFDTSDEAFGFLQKGVIPDIIVCDINLETSTSGGFDFYERLRQDERFSVVPFIFLSGLTDEVVIRTGKELGADDYLTKPVSVDMLMATIKGKLKRFQRLSERQGSPGNPKK